MEKLKLKPIIAASLFLEYKKHVRNTSGDLSCIISLRNQKPGARTEAIAELGTANAGQRSGNPATSH